MGPVDAEPPLRNLGRWLGGLGPRAEPVQAAYGEWLATVMPTWFSPEDAAALVERTTGTGKPEEAEEGMAYAVMEEKLRRQIRRAESKGLALGLEHERRLLSGMAARRFGDGTAGRLAPLLADIGDTEGLERDGAWIVDCADGEELIARFGNGADDMPSPVPPQGACARLETERTRQNSAICRTRSQFSVGVRGHQRLDAEAASLGVGAERSHVPRREGCCASQEGVAPFAFQDIGHPHQLKPREQIGSVECPECLVGESISCSGQTERNGIVQLALRIPLVQSFLLQVAVVLEPVGEVSAEERHRAIVSDPVGMAPQHLLLEARADLAFDLVRRAANSRLRAPAFPESDPIDSPVLPLH